LRTLGTGPQQAAAGNDPRFTLSTGILNYAAARLIVGTVGQTIAVAGCITNGDGGEGQFVWRAGSATDNGGTILLSTGGYWERVKQARKQAYVAWFGGNSNADFYNAANGKWYQDAGLTVEASDDAIKFQSCNNYLASIGGGEAIIGPGDWYFKTKRGDVTGNEFVRVSSNVRWKGRGRDTVIHVAPGCNTLSFGGYSTVIGYVDTTSTPSGVNDVSFQDFTVDHCGHKNQFYTPISGLAYNFFLNNAVRVSAGRNIRIENIQTYRVNGVYNITVGEYGTPTYATDFCIQNCHIWDFCYDSGVSDASYITCGGYRGRITNNNVNGSVSPDSSINFFPWACYELHGTALVIANNQAERAVGGFNLAGDSANFDDVNCYGNTVRYCSAGINLFQYNVNSIRRVRVHNNVIFNCWYAVLLIQDPATTGGTGRIYDLHITDNQAVGDSGAAPRFGISLLCNSSGGGAAAGSIEIARNKLVGFLLGGIQLGTSQANGLVDNASIVDNTIEDCAGVGIKITSPTGDAAANFTRLKIDRNKTYNGLGSMTYGVYTDAWLNSTCFLGQHTSIGHTLAEYLISTAAYASSTIGKYQVSNGCDLGGVVLSGGRVQGAIINRPDGAGAAYTPGNGFSNLYGSIRFYTPSGTSEGLAIEPAAKVATTGVGPTNIQSVVIANNSAFTVVFTVMVYRTGGARGTGAIGDTAKFVRRVTVKYVAGVMSILLTEAIGPDYLDADLNAAGVDITFSTAAGVVIVSGTGAADLNLTWQPNAYIESFVS
jgi:hypothetical protein